MASPYRTGNRAEALMASPEIVGLAQQVLTPEEFDRAIRFSVMLVSSKSKKNQAIQELRRMVSPPPKRPLFYAQHELEFLPRWTRDAIRYLGDYIDVLTKHLAYQLTNAPNVKTFPFGASIKVIEKANLLPDHLIGWLRQYNSFLYRPGKHDFTLPPGRRGHRFTAKEVVLTAFVTIALANILRQYSSCSVDLDCHFDKLTR